MVGGQRSIGFDAFKLPSGVVQVDVRVGGDFKNIARCRVLYILSVLGQVNTQDIARLGVRILYNSKERKSL